MKNTIKLFASFFLMTWFINSNCFASDPSNQNHASSAMLQKVTPTVVNIKAQIKILDFDTYLRLQKENQLPGVNGDIPDKVTSTASGVIVDAKKGYILTNAHAVRDAQQITVTLNDARHYTAKLLGIDNPSDIALLQIQSKNLTNITYGNSNDLEVGDSVFAIGNPYGIGQTVTSGIISGLKRSALGIESLENFIQTDAAINPGNSGGALINTKGELIGINTAIVLSPQRGGTGIGLAIPVNMAKSVMQQLLEFGNVKRGTLGIGVQDITPDLATSFDLSTSKGAVVTLIMPNSPALKAGLQVGDIITNVNGEDIKNANDVVNDISFLRVGSKATIHLLRDNKEMTVTAVIWDPKKSREVSVQMNPLLYGVGLKDFTQFDPHHGDIKGVLVVSVEEDSNAWQSDLHPGDVIVSANRKKVNDIAELNKVVAESKNQLLLNVLRGPGAVFLVISAGA
jgi:serine protease Do